MKATIKKIINRIAGKRKSIIFLTVLCAIGITAAVFWSKRAAASDFMTARVERGNIAVTVSATGTLQAVTTVQVGSQASGTVAWLGADFNSQVKRGQVIARLDDSTLQAQVLSAQANLASAQAGVQAAQTDIANQNANIQAARANGEVMRVQSQDAADVANRYQSLSNVIAGRDIQAAKAQAGAAAGRVAQADAQIGQAQASLRSSEAKLAQARAQVAQAQAQLDQAQVGLSHAVITSPIDGVVVSRSVDVGQTVAASLQAPTLFTIANDLTKMQVLASVDEADVGQIKQGVKADFSVDAFAGQTFSGLVSQVRLNAQAAQNVVTYTAVIEVSNPELKLRPGMTANITFPVEQRENVLNVPNAALRFKPELSQKEQADLQAQVETNIQARRQNRAGQQPAADNAQAPAKTSDASQAPQRAQGQTIWVMNAANKLEPRFVRTGLTNGRVTEIVSGNLQEGETVVIGQNTGAAAKAPQQSASPLGARPNAGFGGGRGR